MTFNYDDLTPEHFSASINWITKMSDKDRWNLTTEEAAILVGMNLTDYIEMQKKAGESNSFSLQTEPAERISLLLGIWRRLQIIGIDEKTASLMFNKANAGDLLKRKSIKQFLLENNSLAAFYAVNLYLESSSGV